MISVGFILPSSDYLHDPFRGDPHTHFQILTVLEDQLGDRVDLSLIDLRGIERRFAFYHIPKCDVYLYSLYSLDFDELISVVTYLRKRFPASRHITGGPHACLYQSDSLKFFDSLIIGEGELSIVEAVTDVVCGNLKPLYKQSKSVDINQFPFPKRKYLPASTVARPGLLATKIKQREVMLSTTAMFSRGCPYSCSFCAMPALKSFSPGIRYRRPDLIEEEIEYLKLEYGIQGISMLDEIGIPPGRESAIRHLEAIGRTGIKWRTQIRVDGITPEIAELASESGCLTLSLGCESPSQRVLDVCNKKVSVERSKQTIQILKANGIEVRVYLVSGLPAEPEDIVKQTKQFIDETQPDLVMCSMFTVRPGTDIYDNPSLYGIKSVTRDYKKMMNLQNRYDNEEIQWTFEYKKETPWGRGFHKEELTANFNEILSFIKDRGMDSASLYYDLFKN